MDGAKEKPATGGTVSGLRRFVAKLQQINSISIETQGCLSVVLPVFVTLLILFIGARL
jgi:hypothetical protein